MRKLLPRREPEAPATPPEFITTLAGARVWILAAGVRGQPSTSGTINPAVLETISTHRKELSELTDGDSLVPFTYEHGGSHMLPFFSSEAGASQFLEHWREADLSLFKPYSVDAAFLVSRKNSSFDLVLDPGATSERTLSPPERKMLHTLADRAS